MYIVLLALHVLISLTLMISVLLQSGRGGGLAGAFGGGGGSQAIFGGRGAATFLTKATTVLGASFMVSSLLLAIMSSHRGEGGKSALERAAEQATEEPAGLPGPGESGFPGSLPEGGAGVPAGEPAESPAGGTSAPALPGGSAPTTPPPAEPPSGGGG